MATVTEPTSPEAGSLHDRQRGLAYGLIWGGAMLAVLALWAKAKHRDFLTVGVIALLVLAAGALGLGIWLLARRASAGHPTAEQVQEWRRNRRLVGTVLLAGGAVLLLFAAWLGFSYGLGAFGEAVGLALFAVIAIVTGLMYRADPDRPPFQDRLMQAVAAQQLPVSIGLVIAGAALAGLGVYLRATLEEPANAFPEWAGAILLGLTWLGCGLWLRFTGSEVTPASMRVFVLVIGGATGLIIALMTLVRAWMWRNEVFLGGMAAWTGPESYRFWLCAYVELGGLAMMFASLLLARADVRVNPVLRRTLYGYNAVVTALLLLALLIVLNIVVYVAYPLSFNWSENQGLYALSPRTQDVLAKLKTQTDVYVLLSPRYKMYQDMRDLLANMTALTDKLTVTYINPDQDIAQYHALAEKYRELLPDFKSLQFEEEVGRGVLVVYGEGTAERKAPRVLIPPRKIAEHKADFHSETGREKLLFHGENALMTELLFLMEGEKKAKVYFLQGNGELDITKTVAHRGVRPGWVELAQLGASRLVDRLRKENLDIKGLSFLPEPEKATADVVHVKEDAKTRRKDIPEDAAVVVLAGTSKEVPKETLDALERYMERNGRLLVLLDVITDRPMKAMLRTGLEEFLKKFQVQVTDQYVHSYPRALTENPLDIYATPALEGENLLAKQFAGQLFWLTTPRIIQAQAGGVKYRADEVLMAYPRLEGQVIWAEDKLTGLSDPIRHSFNLRDRLPLLQARKPLPIGVAVREGEDKPRLLVLGDAELASNSEQLTRVGGQNFGDLSFNFLASSIDWLAERPGVGIRPRETGKFALGTKAQEVRGRMVLTPAWLMGLGILGLGASIWVVRRR